MKKIKVFLVMAMIPMFFTYIDLSAAEAPTASIENINASTSEISFDYSLVDDPENIIMHTEPYIPTVAIYNPDGSLLQEVEAQETAQGESITATFSNLDSNTEYKVAVNAPYDLFGTGEPFNAAPYTIVEQTVNTYKNNATGNIHSNLETNPTEIGYSSLNVIYDIVDADDTVLQGAGFDPQIAIYSENILVDQADAQVGLDVNHKFENLEHNTRYTVELSAYMDLNGDGQPENSDNPVIATEDFVTSSDKFTPVGYIHTEGDPNPTVISDNQIEVHYDIFDHDDALINIDTVRPKIALYENGQIVSSVNAEVGVDMIHTFDISGSGEYMVELRGQYDLDGDGQPENTSPYILYQETFTVVPQGYTALNTCKDLESIGQGPDYPGATHTDSWELSGDYAITSDIDCSATNPSNPNHGTSLETTYGSDGFDSLGELTGNLNGLENEISGLYSQKTTDNGGLISSVSTNGQVVNVGIVDSSVSYNGDTGCLVGENNGLVQNSYSKCSVSGEDNIGGLVGMNHGTVENSYSNSSVEGTDDTGGLVGYNYGQISNTYAQSTVVTDEGGQGDDAGGLVGGNDNGGEILNSFVAGDTKGGSLVGEMFGTSTVKNSFATANSDSGLIESEESFVGEITNTFQLDSATCSEGCNVYPTVDKTNLLDVLWYDSTINSTNQWDTTTIENGMFPKLINTDGSGLVSGQEDIVIPQ